MKEVSLPLRTAYIGLLNGITVSGKTIPAYDEFAPADAPDAYIIITNQTDDENPNKQAFYSNASITVDINTSFLPEYGGKELSEQIADKVLSIIKAANRTQITVSGFQVVTTQKSLSRNLNENLPSRRIFRKIIVFTHKIVQT